MAIQVEWLLENKIIHVVAEGDISIDSTTEETLNLSKSVEALIAQSNEPLVHFFLNEERLTSLPKSLKDFSESVGFLRNERLGWFLIYGNVNRVKMAVFFGSIVIGLAKVRHRRFDTLRECLDFIVLVDSTLPSVEEILAG